jgi:hypothetical protein
MLKAAIVSSCLLVALVGAQQATYLLDLTVVPKPSAPASGSGEGQGVSHTSGGLLPLRLTLTRLDKAEYVLGDPVVYEVTITNTGSVAVTLPWTPWSIDHDLIRQSATEPRPFLLGYVSLEVFDQQHWHHFAVIGLEGTAGYPASVQALLPGESAMIRVPMRVSMIPEDAAEVLASRVNGTVQVRAQLAMMIRPAIWAEPIDSENAISIQLRAPGPK